MEVIDYIRDSKVWVYKEAMRILERVQYSAKAPKCILFETGYGPSGLPHIGTFAEVLRTTLVRRAFMEISDIPTRLICFSDDFDGLRKVPGNIPNQELIARYIDMPLTSVPDPFSEEQSYGHFMNKKLRSFLDAFEFEYEFCSATDYYKSGKFDHMLLRVLDVYDQIMHIMLPTFRDERRATYAPLMPICQKTGKVLQVPLIEINKTKGSVVFIDADGDKQEVPVTGGRCKLQWKPDFGMRWACLGVDYEMYGKDHRPNAKIYSSICSLLGGNPPVQFFYEMFLNEDGDKISKSKGVGITIDQWLHYAPIESLSLYIYHSPATAKRLSFRVIPKMVDEYLSLIRKYNATTEIIDKLSNPVHHVHNGDVPQIEMHGLDFSLLLNLASGCSPENDQVMWGFIKKYAPNADPNKHTYLAKLVMYARRYYEDFVRPTKEYLAPNEPQREVLRAICSMLRALQTMEPMTNEEIQKEIYAIGMEYYDDLKIYFRDFYCIIFGQNEGPRLGSFIQLFGLQETIDLIEAKIT